MTENNMLPSALLEEIHSLKENMERITGFILELKQDYAVLEEKIELNSSDVLRLLGISRASLARWRDSKVILTVMSPAITWSIPSEDCTLQSRRGVLPSKAFVEWKHFKGSMPTKTASRKDIWEIHKFCLRNYEY